jgi:hypothetical protein
MAGVYHRGGIADFRLKIADLESTSARGGKANLKSGICNQARNLFNPTRDYAVKVL